MHDICLVRCQNISQGTEGINSYICCVITGISDISVLCDERGHASEW
jgi:hypothetical protein